MGTETAPLLDIDYIKAKLSMKAKILAIDSSLFRLMSAT